MPLIEGAKFGHLNVTTSDWRSLAAFYQAVFGMDLVPPERDFRSPDLDRATGLTDAHLRGAHLRLPGEPEGGPTLEIFEYEDLEAQRQPAVDRPGWGHIAFRVPDVATARDAVLGGGGSSVGEIVTFTTADGRHVTWCYVADPGGNIVELQTWH
jgi:catechol 2,3-dioxygenase-like lactoylglutathione lyase family enzyme